MIEIKLEQNIDSVSCSYCGEVHKEYIDMSEPNQSGSGFVLSRRCAKKMIADLQKFLKLNASGLYRERQRKPPEPLQQGEV